MCWRTRCRSFAASGDNESFSFKGRVFELRNARLQPKPAQRPAPLLLGGGGEQRTLRIVARWADEWNVTPMPVERYRAKVEVLEAHRERVKRDPGTIARSMMCGFIVGVDERDFRRRFEAMQTVMPSLSQVSVDRAATALAARGWLAGTTSQVVEQIGAVGAEEISRVMLQHLNLADPEVLEVIAREILPRV